MGNSGRLQVSFCLVSIHFFPLHFLNSYNEHELLAKKIVFKVIKKEPKDIKDGVGYRCGLASFQADNGVLCHPFQIQFAF